MGFQHGKAELVLPRLGLVWFGLAKHGLTKKGQAKPKQAGLWSQCGRLSQSKPSNWVHGAKKEIPSQLGNGWLSPWLSRLSATSLEASVL